MSIELDVYKYSSGDIVISDSEYHRLEKLLLFSDLNNKDQDIRMVLKFYNDFLHKKKEIPSIEEIVTKCEDYNSDIIYNMAIIEHFQELGNENVSSDSLSESEIDDIMNDKLPSLEDFYSYNYSYGDSIDILCMRILNSFALCYVSDGDADFSDIISNILSVIPNKQIVYNDCQICLLSLFGDDGYFVQGDKVLYLQNERSRYKNGK
jgi:hypothetical protein